MLTKKSIADCIPTRQLNCKFSLVKIRGQISENKLIEIDRALKLLFDFI